MRWCLELSHLYKSMNQRVEKHRCSTTQVFFVCAQVWPAWSDFRWSERLHCWWQRLHLEAGEHNLRVASEGGAIEVNGGAAQPAGRAPVVLLQHCHLAGIPQIDYLSKKHARNWLDAVSVQRYYQRDQAEFQWWRFIASLTSHQFRFVASTASLTSVSAVTQTSISFSTSQMVHAFMSGPVTNCTGKS